MKKQKNYQKKNYGKEAGGNPRTKTIKVCRLDAQVRLKTAGEFRMGQEVRKGNKIGNILEVIDNKTVKVDYGLYTKTENSFELETVD